MAKRLLLITDHFPPKGNIASLRMESIVQYLSPEEFEITVLTTGEGLTGEEKAMGARVLRVPECHYLSRLAFGGKISPLNHKLRALWNRILRIIEIDENPGFRKWGSEKAIELHREQRFDIVIGSYPSLASLRIVRELKQTDPTIFAVLDFRDGLTHNSDVDFWSRIRLKMWEKRLFKAADMAFSVSRPLIESFEKITSREVPCIEIRNGFNFEPIKETKNSGPKLEILYAGSLYHKRNLNTFFDALMSLPKEVRSQIHLRVMGGNPTQWLPDELKNSVSVDGRVDYSEMPKHFSRADALLLVIPTTSNTGVYTGKLFDYLAVNRPILGLVPRGDVAEQLILEANAGYCSANEDVEGIARNLRSLYEDWKANRLPSRNWQVVSRHHRREQVKRLRNAILNELPN